MSDEAAAPNAEPTNDAPPSDAGRSLLGDPVDFYKAKEPEAVEPEGKTDEPEGQEPEGGEPEPEKRAEDEPAPEGEGVAEGDGEEGDGDEGEPVTTAHELEESQGWPPGFLGDLKYRIKVHGKTSEIPIKDMAASYEIGTATKERLDEAKAIVKTANEKATRQNEEAQRQIGIGAKMLKFAEETLTNEMNAVDWTRLKEDDPGEYSARRLEFQERRDAIEQRKAEAREELERATVQHQEEQKEQHKQYLQQENALLLDAVPEWKDEKVAKSEKGEIAEYLMKRGFSQEDVMNAADHRLIVIARESMLYNQMKSTSDTPKKRVVKAPRVVKPGSKVDSKPTSPSEKATTELFYGKA